MRKELKQRRDRVIQRLHSCSGNRLTDRSEQHALAHIAHRVYRNLRESPEVLRKAAFLEAFAQEMPIKLVQGERLVGSQCFAVPPWQEILGTEAAEAMLYRGNLGHIIVDYGMILQLGVAGLQQRIHDMPRDTEQQRRNRDAFARSLKAFSRFIGRHADLAAAQGHEDIASVCRWIRQQPPRTFHEALQLVWFVQIFLHAEAPSTAAFSFGRLDQWLYAFLRQDLDQAHLTLEDAHELLAAFFLKCCEGEESQNLVVGGCDAAGGNAENVLSQLCLQVCRDLRVWQPSLSVRLRPDSSEAFRQGAFELAAAGFGMPSFVNDPVVIRALQTTGLPTARARDYGIVGCYEAAPAGDTVPYTVAGRILLPHVFRQWLDRSDFFETYADCERSFFAALEQHYLEELLPTFAEHWRWRAANTASPFESLCLTGCIASGRCAEEGGARQSLFGVNILGFGTLVDSLYAIKRLVFEEKVLTLRQVKSALAGDFPDETVRVRCQRLSGKYGTGNGDSSALARRLSEKLGRLVLAHPMAHGVRPYPGLFLFGGDIMMDAPATPDGRRAGEALSYGCGPGVYGPSREPTDVLRSAASLRHDLFACGNPLLISLPISTSSASCPTEDIRSLVDGYFQSGGFQVHFNVTSADRLRQARSHPEQHADLMVRVSGYSARFTSLPKRWQDALIERTGKGL